MPVKELYEDLERGLQTVFASDEYQEWLDVATRFHTYSWGNTILILQQMPEATTVAGYRAWQKLGRQVRKGERAIRILAPMMGKVPAENDEVEYRLFGFRYVSVFDVSQTDGEELPSLTASKLLGSDFGQHLPMLKRIAEAEGIEVEFGDTGDAGGYYRAGTSRDKPFIKIDSEAAPDHQVKTFIHELAHHFTHENRLDMATGEVVAESVAYIVSSTLGLDTSSYSFGYVAGWSEGKELEALKRVAQLICDTSKVLIGELVGFVEESEFSEIA